MIFENEHYRLQIIPTFVRKVNEFEEITCVHCNGSGIDNNDDLAGGLVSCHTNCSWCRGSGFQKRLKVIPPPPEIDMDFVNFMREAFKEYRKNT